MHRGLREAHFEVRIPLGFIVAGALGACMEIGSWTAAGYIISGLLTFVLLTHRWHNAAAEWTHDNTDYSNGCW
jgi:hypothetical protein